MFIHNESQIHLEAKNIVAEIFNNWGDGIQAFTEYPLMKYGYGENTWSPMMCSTQAQVPSYKECEQRFGNYKYGPFKVVDVAVFNKYKRLECLFEICHTNPVPNDKINRIKQEGLMLLEVSARAVVAMKERSPDNLRTICYRLC
jgi:hypothetical protein